MRHRSFDIKHEEDERVKEETTQPSSHAVAVSGEGDNATVIDVKDKAIDGGVNGEHVAATNTQSEAMEEPESLL